MCPCFPFFPFHSFLSYKMFPSFSTYDAFLAGLGESLVTEFYCETYPDYAEECETMDDVEAKYIRHFLAAGLDAQEGLSKILECFFNNTRYAQEGNMLTSCIQPFLDAGASLFPLTSTIVTIPSGNLEDESTSIEVRSRILDAFWRHMDQEYIQGITDWTTVVPKYWEYISTEDTPFVAMCKYYKCCSDYLRGEHMRFAGLEDEEGLRENANREYMDAMMDGDGDSDSE